MSSSIAFASPLCNISSISHKFDYNGVTYEVDKVTTQHILAAFLTGEPITQVAKELHLASRVAEYVIASDQYLDYRGMTPEDIWGTRTSNVGKRTKEACEHFFKSRDLDKIAIDMRLSRLLLDSLLFSDDYAKERGTEYSKRVKYIDSMLRCGNEYRASIESIRFMGAVGDLCKAAYEAILVHDSIASTCVKFHVTPNLLRIWVLLNADLTNIDMSTLAHMELITVHNLCCFFDSSDNNVIKQ